MSHAPVTKLEIVDDFSASARCDEGFLQLRRLRVERMAFFSALLAMVGFWARADTAEAVIGAVLTSGLFVLVHDRFSRFCDVIARGFLVVESSTSRLGGTAVPTAQVQASDE